MLYMRSVMLANDAGAAGPEYIPSSEAPADAQSNWLHAFQDYINQKLYNEF